MIGYCSVVCQFEWILNGEEIIMKNTSASPARISPFARLVGLQFSRGDDETPQCSLDIGDRVLNVNGTVHGGAIHTLIDVSMGWFLFDQLREDERIATVEVKINYLAAVSSGVLVARAKLIHRSRRLAVLESQVDCEGQIIAKAMGTFYVSRTRKADD
jgi:acyl-CoA thioesterase